MTEVILFDLGGVLVRLTGVPTMLEWTPGNLDERELWSRWLTSSSVRAFESGQIDPDTFAKSTIEEFRLSVTPDTFIAVFETWTDGLFEGVEEMLADLGSRFRLATMSNTNAVHWPKLSEQMGLGRLIDTHFPSHQTGLLKPDHEAFENVVSQLGVAADRIRFFDDNEMNVTAASACGLNAHIARGPADILTAINGATSA